MAVVLVRFGFTLGIFIGSAVPAYAYVGPGAGLTAIGAVLALFGAVLLAIVGFLWYPIKRLRARRRERARAGARQPET